MLLERGQMTTRAVTTTDEATLTEQAQRLRQDTLRRQLDDLTRVWPILQGNHGEKKRKKQLLGEQKLQGRLLEGYSIAERRGLAYLLKEYQHVVMRHIKHRQRQASCAAGAMVTTGEDVDLEVRYEQMRMSPLLTEATQHMTFQGMCSPSAAGKRFRKDFSDSLCRYSEQVQEAAAAGLERHAALSVHEEFLGVSHAH